MIQNGTYGVYGRISYYRDWIDDKMQAAKFCPSGAHAAAQSARPLRGAAADHDLRGARGPHQGPR